MLFFFASKSISNSQKKRIVFKVLSGSVYIYYICIMKKFFTFLALIVAFVFQANAIGLPLSEEQNKTENTTFGAIQESLPVPLRNIADNKWAFINTGNESLVINIHFQFVKTTQRVFSSSHTGRIRNFKQLTNLQYFNLKKIRLILLAYNQLSGYYLFHLRKLLI